MTPAPHPTGAAREPMTLEQAMRAHKPEPFTDAEWAALHRASVAEAERGVWRAAARSPYRWRRWQTAVPITPEP